MAEEDQCVNEKKALLQHHLPGVTLHNSTAYYHQRRPSSDMSCPHSQEIDQLQQQILISKALNRMASDDSNDYSTIISGSTSSKRDPNNAGTVESSGIDILWIDKNSNIDSYSDADDFEDDIASYSFSIRKVAALSEAKRRTDERYFMYMKCILLLFICFFMGDEFLARRTKKTTTNLRSNDSSFRERFRFDRHWRKKVQSLYLGQEVGRDDNDRKKILTILKDLDESIHGDIVLRSNKTTFLDAAMVWQRRDWAFDEESPLPSSIKPRLPPLAVVEASSVEDVKFAVPILGGLARDYHLDFRVRSGGHAYMNGYSTISDGVMLNLANLNSIAINEQNGDEAGGILNGTQTTVVMGPGVRTEDFMEKILNENGYSGIVASAAGVGMGGFVLGGGYGLQSRMYGLAIDNVVGLQVVLPGGEMKKVKEGDDLFWALLGAGGGNIGVVTSMEYQVYSSHDIKLAASVKISLPEMIEFLQRVAEKETELAAEFTLKVEGYIPSNDTAPSLSSTGISDMLTGVTTIEENGLVLLSMYWMGESNPDDPVGMKYIKKEIVPLFSDDSVADNIAYYYFSWSGMSREREQNDEMKSVWSAESWNGFLLPTNNTQEIWKDIHSSLSAMFMYCRFVSPRIELWGGAISKIPSNATVFPHRNAIYNVGIDVIVPSESDADAAYDEINLVNAIWPSIERHLVGVYVNYPMASLSNESYPTAYWGNNLDRLVSLTERYDPSRVMKVSQAVPTNLNGTSS